MNAHARRTSEQSTAIRSDANVCSCIFPAWFAASLRSVTSAPRAPGAVSAGWRIAEGGPRRVLVAEGRGASPGGCRGRSHARDTARAMSQENVESLRGVRITLPPGGDNAGQRRTPDERLAVRFPRVSLVLARSLMRLSPRSRLRRLLVTRRIQQSYAAANRRDYESVLLGWDAASEYRPTRELMPPDLDAAFHGHGGMHQLWRYWRDAFEDIRWEPEEILDLGDKVLITAKQTGHGTGSGVAVSQHVFQLFTLRKGLVVRQEDFLDRSAALEAAGLSE